MPDLSDHGRSRRQRVVGFARGSVQLSGGELDPEVEALNARYVAGEMSDDEHGAAVIAHARTFAERRAGAGIFQLLRGSYKGEASLMHGTADTLSEPTAEAGTVTALRMVRIAGGNLAKGVER